MPTFVMHQLFQITTGDAQIARAVEEVGGLGPLLLARGPDPIGKVLERGKASGESMADWTCGLAFFLRENPEDREVVIACAEPLATVFEEIGAIAGAAGVFIWDTGK